MFENPTEKFRNELNPGERMIWSGQPQQGFMLRPGDIFLIPFSFLWGGFIIFWGFGCVTSGVPFFLMMLFGIPFVLIWIYIVIGRFFGDVAQRDNTYYALTNERVIIISGLSTQNIKSLSLKMLSEINISARANGKGTITFGSLPPMSWMYTGGGFPNNGRYAMPPSFEMIEDAKSVYQQIKQLQREGT